MPSWIHFLIESLQRRFGDYTIPDDVHGLVISPGGVASTSIMKHLNDYVPINDTGDRDGLKHRPGPPKNLKSQLPVLLIIGDTDLVITSLEARGYLPHQASRLGCWRYFLTRPSQRHRILATAIADQQRRWTHSSNRLLVVHFEELWTRQSEIADLFDITDPSFLETFPPRRQRNSRRA